MKESLACLTARFGLSPLPPPEHPRDVEIQRLYEREQLAAALTELVAAVQREAAPRPATPRLQEAAPGPPPRAARAADPGPVETRAAEKAPEKAPGRGRG